MMRALRLAFCLAFCSACSMPLFGAAISGGSIQTTGIAGFGTFTLSGSNFDASGGFDNGNWGLTSCSPCTPGSTLSVDGLVSGNAFVGGGAATINGTAFSNVNWGDLNAQGPSIFMITGPGIVLNNGAGTYLGSFSFTGSLCGTIDFSGACAANLPTLTGSGQVAVQIVSYVNNGQTFLNYEQATYTFLPVPEPSSLLLFGSAVLGLGSVVRRKIDL
jgi:hypothetical protein